MQTLLRLHFITLLPAANLILPTQMPKHLTHQLQTQYSLYRIFSQQRTKMLQPLVHLWKLVSARRRLLLVQLSPNWAHFLWGLLHPFHLLTCTAMHIFPPSPHFVHSTLPTFLPCPLCTRHTLLLLPLLLHHPELGPSQ